MSEEQSQRDDNEAPPSVPLANAWAMTTVLSFLTVAVVTAFFAGNVYWTNKLTYAQSTISRQQHCIAVRRACHNDELTPRLCDLRARQGLRARDFGPTIDGVFQGESCPGALAGPEGLCELVETTVPTVSCDEPGQTAPANNPPT